MIPYPKVIFFDLDDTLISFEGVAEQAWMKCCSDLINNHKLPYDSAVLLDQINTTRKWYWNDPDRHKRGRGDLITARREITALAMEQLNVHDNILSIELADSYSDHRDRLIYIYPNTISTLKKLRSAGIRLGMITNGTSGSQRGKLERFDLVNYFEHIFIESETGFGKPDKRIYETALSRFNVSPQDCWMIGDNLIWDIQAPKELGMSAIWYDQNSMGLPQNSVIIPDHIVSDISELLVHLRK